MFKVAKYCLMFFEEENSTEIYASDVVTWDKGGKRQGTKVDT